MSTPEQALAEGDGILVVDVQNDFCPGGALPIAAGDEVVPVVNRWLATAGERHLPVYASRDWHPEGHPSFKSAGGEWPRHCVQDTEGAAFHPLLKLPEGAVIVTKGVRFDKDQYSAFDETGLAERLRQDGVGRLWVAGLAEDVCVRATVLGAIEAGFEVILIKDAVRPVTEEGGKVADREMQAAGAQFETTDPPEN